MTWEKTGILSGSAGNWTYSANTDIGSWKINGVAVSAVANDSGDMSNPSQAHDYRTADIDGKAYREDYYFIDDEGNIASRTDYTSNQLAYNEEMVFTYDGFTGTDGKIDLVLAPEIFTQAGMR